MIKIMGLNSIVTLSTNIIVRSGHCIGIVYKFVLFVSVKSSLENE
jgi:hypothetical protein